MSNDTRMVAVVLDFYTGKVHFHEYDMTNNIEDDLHRWGYDLSNIQYMTTSINKIQIQDLLK